MCKPGGGVEEAKLVTLVVLCLNDECVGNEERCKNFDAGAGRSCGGERTITCAK